MREGRVVVLVCVVGIVGVGAAALFRRDRGAPPVALCGASSMRAAADPAPALSASRPGPASAALSSGTLGGVDASAPLDEASLMARLHGVDGTDPRQALALAREGNERFPNGPGAAERAAIVVKSLALQGRLSEARGEAEIMVNRYAGTRWAREVEQHTGAHPHVDR